MLLRAHNGAAHEGDWLIAEHQTAGRGRQGRNWESLPGNLYASGLVELRPGDPFAPTLALVAGVALYDALNMHGSLLKWPNDLLLVVRSAGGEELAKCAGILLERAERAIVVGIGANLASHPHLRDRATTSLSAVGRSLTVDAAIEALARSFARWLAVWRGDGLAPVVQAWAHRAHSPGTPLSAAPPDGTRLSGTFEGLGDDGSLRLRLADGATRVIHAGDVFLI